MDALEGLRAKADGAELALVFYAGHGMEGADGNVLAPVDMEVDCTARSKVRRGVPLAGAVQGSKGRAPEDRHSRRVPKRPPAAMSQRAASSR